MPKLTVLDDKVLFAANWDRGHPWRLLGTRCRKDMGIEEGLELIGVGREIVEPANLYTVDDSKVFDSQHGPAVLLYDLKEVEGKIGVKSNVFGVMSTASSSYEITQRREMLEVAFEIVGLDQDNAHIDTIGNAGDKGELFFAYIQVPDLVIDPSGVADVVERGLFVGTSFNGSLPNTIGYSNIRVACSNAIMVAMKGLQQAIKVKHTRNSEERIQTAAQALHYIGAVEKKVVKKAEEMLRVKDGDRALSNIIKHFYPVDDEGLGEQTKSRRLMERGKIRTLYDGDDNRNVELVGRNGYAAYQAFVEYVDHERGVKARGRNESKVRAQAAVLPGRIVDMKIKASELVVR